MFQHQDHHQCKIPFTRVPGFPLTSKSASFGGKNNIIYISCLQINDNEIISKTKTITKEKLWKLLYFSTNQKVIVWRFTKLFVVSWSFCYLLYFLTLVGFLRLWHQFYGFLLAWQYWKFWKCWWIPSSVANMVEAVGCGKTIKSSWTTKRLHVLNSGSILVISTQIPAYWSFYQLGISVENNCRVV